MTSVTIPNSVTSIGEGIFIDCYNFSDIYCYAEEVPSIDSYAFSYSNIQDATLHVPGSALLSYKETYPWSSFGYFKAIDTSGVESLESRGVVIKSAGGFITLSGLHTNERVYFYTIDGTALGSATAADGTAAFSATSGTIVVAKIGKESVKIVVR